MAGLNSDWKTNKFYDKVLTDLYKIKQDAQNCPVAIDNLINDVELEISKDSVQNVGFESRSRVFRKWITKSRKDLGVWGVMKAGVGRWVLVHPSGVIRLHSDMKLPVDRDHGAQAKRWWDEVEEAKRKCKDVLPMPSCAEIDTFIRTSKAAKRPANYAFGDDAPSVPAKLLHDLHSVMPFAHVHFCKAKGKGSAVYLRGDCIDGIIWPA